MPCWPLVVLAVLSQYLRRFLGEDRVSAMLMERPEVPPLDLVHVLDVYQAWLLQPLRPCFELQHRHLGVRVYFILHGHVSLCPFRGVSVTLDVLGRQLEKRDHITRHLHYAHGMAPGVAELIVLLIALEKHRSARQCLLKRRQPQDHAPDRLNPLTRKTLFASESGLRRPLPPAHGGTDCFLTLTCEHGFEEMYLYYGDERCMVVCRVVVYIV